MTALLVFDSDAPKISFQVNDGQSLKVGRAATCDVVIDSPMLGAWQASLRATRGVVVVEPASAPTGTFLNGLKVVGSQALKPGDELKLGGVTFKVSRGR